MPETPLTCADVEARDLDAEYLAERLSPEDALAYEAHYFSCERCWAALRLATEARAAFAAESGRSARPAATAPNATLAPRADPERSRRRIPWGLAAAAVLVVAVGIGVLEIPGVVRIPVVGGIAGDEEDGTTLRGTATVFQLHPSVVGDSLRVLWTADPDADRYRVRLFRADGSVLFDREISDTTITIPNAALEPTSARGPLYWQVHVLDRTRATRSRSALTPALPESPP